MPSLIFFGRPLAVASDDFVFPCITEIIVRVIWLAVASIFAIVQNPWECKTYHWLPLFVTLYVITVISIVLATITAYLSSCGSIMDVAARKHVSTLLYLRIPVFTIEVMWTLTSTLILFNFFNANIESCTFILSGIRWTIVVEWILIISIIVVVLCIFYPVGHTVNDSFAVENSWKKHLCLCKIMQGGEVRQAVDDIACLFASFFSGSDLVFSDVVAGLLLHIHSPPKTTNQENNELETSSFIASQSEVPTWMGIEECYESIGRFLDFSIAIYAWPHFLVTNCGYRSWQLLRRICFCCTTNLPRRVNAIGDNCFSCSTNALLLSLDDDVEPYFVSFRNHLFTTPFAVLIDSKTCSIVITIRGSASLMDLVMDLSFHDDLLDLLESVDVKSDPVLNESEEFAHTSQSDERRVHRGMLNGARYIFEVLNFNRILEELFALHPDYQLVICGHSLGAGIGSLLCLLLKSKFPDVRCYAFSPPGSVVSESLIKDTQNHVLSIILEDDIIPRITYHSLFRLKSNIEHELRATTGSKHEILIKGFFKLFFPSTWRHRHGHLEAHGSFRRLVENRNSFDTQQDSGSSDESRQRATSPAQVRKR